MGNGKDSPVWPASACLSQVGGRWSLSLPKCYPSTDTWRFVSRRLPINLGWVEGRETQQYQIFWQLR